MAKRPVAPLSIDELFERFSGDPREAVTFVSNLHRYPNLSELDAVIRTDCRFRAPLLRFVACLHEAKDALPWMFRLVPRSDPAFVPALLDVWRAWNGTISAKAQETLLEIGDRRALDAMAALAGKTPPAFRVGPIEALMRLDAAKAYDRAMAVLAVDPRADWIVLGEVTKEHVAADPRWIEETDVLDVRDGRGEAPEAVTLNRARCRRFFRPRGARRRGRFPW